jgi:DNA polymerase/3'-5' exonuclease PolX
MNLLNDCRTSDFEYYRRDGEAEERARRMDPHGELPDVNWRNVLAEFETTPPGTPEAGNGGRMKLEDAQRIAAEAVADLAPFCARIEIAGSIRRRRPEVGDIEIVAISKRELNPDSLLPEYERSPGFIATVNRWPAIRGQATGKYTQRLLPEGIKLDLFTACLDNWGLILAIRTGSAAFSRKVLACGWVRAGFRSVGGLLRDARNEITPIQEERDLFRLICEPWREPWGREIEG